MTSSQSVGLLSNNAANIKGEIGQLKILSKSMMQKLTSPYPLSDGDKTKLGQFYLSRENAILVICKTTSG